MFVYAVWYLKAAGFCVEPTKTVCKRGRFYRVYDPTEEVPPMMLLPRSVIAVAKALYDSTEAEKKEKTHASIRTANAPPLPLPVPYT